MFADKILLPPLKFLRHTSFTDPIVLNDFIDNNIIQISLVFCKLIHTISSS
jgi:hypothetical protein